MSDEYPGRTAPEAATPFPVASPPAGWYPDPWSGSQHRYWDGSAWTGGSFPHGPANPGAGDGTDAAEVSSPPLVPPPAGPDPSPPAPPEWVPPFTAPAWSPPPRPDDWSSPVIADGPITPRPRWASGLGFVALVVGIMIVVGSLGTWGGYLVFRHRTAPTPSASGVPSTVGPTIPRPTPTVPPDPSASALDSLVLKQADVPSTVVVQPRPDSGQVSAEAGTLDLCNGTFPSESRRTARLQVSAIDGSANELLSTEAVLYASPAAAEQAFAELTSTAAHCPPTPVVSPIGGGALTTHFNTAPDGAWSQTPTVTRQAYDFTITDDIGATTHLETVYLRRGRALMAIYFLQPDSPQVTVAGQSTLETIAGVFAGRMASLPASVVNG